MPEERKVRPRPKVVPGDTYEMPTGCGSLFVTVTFDGDNEPLEVFARLGKSGGCASATLEAIGRAISLGLRGEIPFKRYTKSLRGISCGQATLDEGEKILSCVDACARAMELAVETRRKARDAKA